MAEDGLRKIASLLRERDVIDEKIAAVIHRPMTTGHLGEWIASQVFDIELDTLAVAAAIDGRFRAGLLQGRNVNVKWYLKRDAPGPGEGRPGRVLRLVRDGISGSGQVLLVIRTGRAGSRRRAAGR